MRPLLPYKYWTAFFHLVWICVVGNASPFRLIIRKCAEWHGYCHLWRTVILIGLCQHLLRTLLQVRGDKVWELNFPIAGTRVLCRRLVFQFCRMLRRLGPKNWCWSLTGFHCVLGILYLGILHLGVFHRIEGIPVGGHPRDRFLITITRL